MLHVLLQNEREKKLSVTLKPHDTPNLSRIRTIHLFVSTLSSSELRIYCMTLLHKFQTCFGCYNPENHPHHLPCQMELKIKVLWRSDLVNMAMNKTFSVKEFGVCVGSGKTIRWNNTAWRRNSAFLASTLTWGVSGISPFGYHPDCQVLILNCLIQPSVTDKLQLALTNKQLPQNRILHVALTQTYIKISHCALCRVMLCTE